MKTSFRRFIVLAISALVTTGSLFAADPADLVPGTSVERHLDVGEVHFYRTWLEPGAWLLTVRQHGGNAKATWTLPDGERVGPFDSPTGFRGVETALLVFDPPGGEVGLEIAEASARVGGRYRLVLERAPEAIRAAEAAATEAGHAFAKGDRNAALELYRRALALSPPGDDAGRARILGVLAVLLTRDDPSEAIELHREAATLWRKLGEKEWEAIALNRLGLALDRHGRSGESQRFFTAAVDLWRELGDPRAEATARRNQCLALQRQGEFSAARDCYEPLLDLFQQLGDSDGEIRTKFNLVGVYWKLGYADLTLRLHNEVLQTIRSQGRVADEAHALRNRAKHLVELGEVEDAILDLDRALQFFRRSEDRGLEGQVLIELGRAYQTLGECRRALHLSRQALTLLRSVGDRRSAATALRAAGQSAACLELWPKALDAYGRALALSQELDDARGEAAVYRQIGEVHAAEGSWPRAAAGLRRAAALQRQLGDRRLEARALLEAGKVLRRMEKPDESLTALTTALDVFRDVRDRGEQARTLEARARTLHALGRQEEALADIAAAVELLGDLRTRAGGLRQRSAFLATRRDAYDLYIHFLMQRHRDDLQAGWDRRAFAISEQARSRALLDALDRSDAAPSDAAPSDAQRRTLRDAAHRLAVVVERQMQILAREHDPAEATVADRDVYRALGTLERLRAEARRGTTGAAAAGVAAVDVAGGIETFGVEQTQELLDEETLFLEIGLGEENSYLWAMSRDSFASFELPSRDEIATLARRVHSDLSAVDLRTGRTPREARDRLARLLLTPIAEWLVRFERLAVAADGALHYVPFAALPWREGTPLIVSHEIVALPSATALAFQRRAREVRISRKIGKNNGKRKRVDLERSTPEKTTPERTVAIFADPVFAATKKEPAEKESVETMQDPILLRAGLGDLVALPATRTEAQAIAALVPPARRLLALGTDARRERVLDGELAGYRYVHFATHGVLNARHPELSGIVLSQVDAAGAPRNGYLSMDDLYDLDLDAAELVVLSGCRTALGRETRGEGLLGLGHGFMAAGATRVAASLWPVQDRAAAEFMARFYRAMLEGEQTPAAALTAAGRLISKERRWSDPYFWAAFVLVGDWR